MEENMVLWDQSPYTSAISLEHHFKNIESLQTHSYQLNFYFGNSLPTVRKNYK